MKRSSKILSSIFVSLLLAALISVPGASARIGFVDNNIWLSKDNPLAGEQVKIYSVIDNSSDNDISGAIWFYDNNSVVGNPQPFYAKADGVSKVSVVWTATEGNHQFKARIFNVVSIDSSGNRAAVNGDAVSQTDVIYIDADSDYDGIANREEVSRGTNPYDADTDHDGENDSIDPAPTNGNVTTGPDTDSDGISDKVDPDRDNDGLTNEEEARLGTDQLNRDTDNDSVNDKEDYYPLDRSRFKKEVEVKLETVTGGTAKASIAATDFTLKKRTGQPPAEIITSPENAMAARQKVLGEMISSNDNEASGTDSAAVLEQAQDAKAGFQPAEESGNAAKTQGRFGFLASPKFINLFKILALLTLVAGLAFYKLSRKPAGAKRPEADLEID